MDIAIAKISQVIDSASQSVTKRVRRIQQDDEFSRQLVAWLVEDRRTLQRERLSEKSV